MFGGKKAKLKEKLIDGDPDIIEEVYKFYDYDKPQDKIELQAYLNCNNAYKVIVILNSGKETTIEYLCIKIAEQMENFQEFENLEGLKAVNLSKKTEKGIVKLPISGEIDNFINDGDIVYCDLNTDEYWVKTTIKMNSGSSLLLINLDIKFRLDTIIKKLRFLLMKLGINFWIDTASQVKDYNHYIFTSLNFKTLKSKNNIDYSVSDLKKGLSIEKSKIYSFVIILIIFQIFYNQMIFLHH